MTKILTVSPIPPENGGTVGGGVQTVLLDLYENLPGSFSKALFVTNPDASQEGALRRRTLLSLFDEVSTLPAPRNPWEKVLVTLRRLRYLTPMEALRLAGAGAFLLFNPLRFLHHGACLAKALHDHAPDLLHVHMVDHPATYAVLLRRKIPLVVTIHSFNAMKTGDAFGDRRHRRLVAFNLKRIEHAVSVSSFVSEEAEREFGYRGATLVTNAVDTRRFVPAPDRKEPGGALRVLYTGQLVPRKAVDVLLRALSLVREAGHSVLLDVVGEGPERARLESIARELDLEDAVRFRGRLDRESIRRSLPLHDLFVMPSTNEGLSMSMLEALSSGLCVIAGRPSVGSYDALEEGRNGFYYTFGSEEDLAGKMRLVIEDEDLRKSMQKAARKIMVERFDIRGNAARVAEIFREALER